MTGSQGRARTATLILNPRSGGGRHQSAVREAARRRGVYIRELGPHDDPAAQAASSETDVLVVAGGDGTVSAVAAVAVERDLPLVVLPCGTRNHFAGDAGLDTDDPAAGIVALDGDVESRIDLGAVNDHVFVNTASIGFYASMVSDPQYRRRRTRITGRYVRRAVLGGGDPLVVSTRRPARVVVPDQVLTVLVSNNAYSPGLAPGASLRPRLDEGSLWVHVLGLDRRRGAVPVRIVGAAWSLITGRAQVSAWPATTQTFTADREYVTIALDGETVELKSPLVFSARPGALRLLRAADPSGPTELRFEVGT